MFSQANRKSDRSPACIRLWNSSFASASLALVFLFSSPTAAQTSPSSPSRPFQYRDTLNGFYPPPEMSVADENSPYRVILQRILATYPRLPADENLIQALLLVLVAKQKHLIIRTPDSDVSKVLKQTVNVSSQSEPMVITGSDALQYSKGVNNMSVDLCIIH